MKEKNEDWINKMSFKFGIRQEDLVKRGKLVEYVHKECIAFCELMSKHYLVDELGLNEEDVRDLIIFSFFGTLDEREKMVFLYSAFETEKQYRYLKKE